MFRRPRNRSTVLCLLCVISLLAPGCTKYAVLISTNEVSADDVIIHSEWWYDLFAQYQMLREQGFDDADIYVLYGNGTDWNTSHPEYNATTQFGHSITDMAVSKADIQTVFTNLQSQVGSRDHLYVWWMGHGSGGAACNLTMSISNTGESVTDAELASYLSGITSYRKRSINIMTCHSGGLVDDFSAAGNKTVLLASSTCAESSYDEPSTCDGILRAEFNYDQPNALREQDPCATAVAADTDGDGSVSWQEAFQSVQATMTTSTPQLGDPDSLAATTAIGDSWP
ncbi:MAG: hypothetical protein OES32_07165 [Acidobacteriota bacterium]|nr:hypothetical protein [Acidobacteriota bacterium]